MRHNIHGYPGQTIEEIKMAMSGTTTIVTSINGLTADNLMCEGTIVTKTIITLVIDMATKASYVKANNGLWNDTATGFVKFFALDGFFSEWTTLRNEVVRIVGRSCSVSKEIEVKSGLTTDFLNETFTIITKKDFTIIETCKDDNAQIQGFL